eukprot:TRINITY_DN1631_c0_g1_i1.p1 TRINITY_DN1631_c0_g1~~TRINITY_DN1631_c0_g1_i1.p1  ORF type:complete len:128 (+),score=26.98 TRINITY_DN1631_c0_g1_i1:43-384(+)
MMAMTVLAADTKVVVVDPVDGDEEMRKEMQYTDDEVNPEGEQESNVKKSYLGVVLIVLSVIVVLCSCATYYVYRKRVARRTEIQQLQKRMYNELGPDAEKGEEDDYKPPTMKQ